MLKRIGLMIALLAFLAFPLVSWAQQGEAKPAASAPAQSKAEPGHPPGYGHQHGHEKAEEPGESHGRGHGEDPGGGRHGKMMKCMAMQEKSEKAMADIKAMDDRLDEKLAALKNAKAGDKMGAMEAVLTELVTQRKEMRDKLGEMHHQKAMCGMMCKGGRHGKMGHGGMKGMGNKCPMMEGMQHGSGDQSGAAEAAKPEVKN